MRVFEAPIAILVLALAPSSGCSRKSSPEPGSAPPATASHVGGSATGRPTSDELRAGEHAVWTGRCAEIVRKMQAELATLPSPCATDRDCVCYGGGVESVTDCGGVSDRATADRIGALQGEFTVAQCAYGVDCAPSICSTGCRQARCTTLGVEGSSATARPESR